MLKGYRDNVHVWVQLEIAQLEIGRLNWHLKSILEDRQKIADILCEAIQNQSPEEPQNSGTAESPRSIPDEEIAESKKHTCSLSAFGSVFQCHQARLLTEDDASFDPSVFLNEETVSEC